MLIRIMGQPVEKGGSRANSRLRDGLRAKLASCGSWSERQLPAALAPIAWCHPVIVRDDDAVPVAPAGRRAPSPACRAHRRCLTVHARRAASSRKHAASLTRELRQVLGRAGLVSRGRNAQFRPVRLNPAPLASAAQWLGDYRRSWDEGLHQLDAYVKDLQREEGQLACGRKGR
jgi:hypothetical protein